MKDDIERMRSIVAEKIADAVEGLCVISNFNVTPDVLTFLQNARSMESNKLAVDILDIIIENHVSASQIGLPVCQDTGIVVVFAEVGQDLHIVGDFRKAIESGVRRAYRKAKLRNSVVRDPLFDRTNTGDNCPAIIHTELVAGNSLRLIVMPKGAGAENMSRIAMLNPTDGEDGIAAFIIETVRQAGGNACPPIIVGVGIGGDFEYAAILAKKALTIDLDIQNPDPNWANLESKALSEINRLGIGPQGLGGKTTALAVKILHAPCHIASLPVAINIQCHAARHAEIIL